MTAGERFKNWIEALSVSWGDRLRSWWASLINKGLTTMLEGAEPQTKELMRESLTKMLESPGMTPELRTALEASLEKGDWVATLFGYIGMVLGSVIGIFAMGGPPGRVQEYAVDRVAQSMRLDPMAIITAWRRDPEKYAGLFEDLKDQGWDDVRIEALKFYTLFYPPPADLIMMQAREVFEPQMIAKYGLDDELENIRREPFHKAGMTEEQITNYWRAHWEHASWMQIVEMLHRGLITEEDVYDWFRLVEIPPFWRGLLIQAAYTWPTRVDVRRWWDMRTIDEPRLRELYSGMGYRGKNLDDYVLWTKVYVAFPDLMARWSKGWITLDTVRAELIALGMPAARLEEFIQMKVKAEQPERISGERDVSKTDIIKGVKQGVITRDEGAEILVDMGYDEDEAVYILEINIPRDQEDVVVTQRQLTKADILKGLKTKVVSREDAKSQLMTLRYSSIDAEFLLKIFDAQVKLPEEPRQREASKADIVLAVTKGLIAPEEAYLMLLDLDFTPEASQFILWVKAEVSPFSPVNYAEFKDRAHKYRVATGMEAKPMPEEVKKAADLVVALSGEVEALERSIADEERGLIDEEPLPEAATKRIKTLRTKRNRAISELERAKSEYNRQIAEWKHGLP